MTFCDQCYKSLTSVLHNGKPPFFCSPACKRQYLEELKEYRKK